MDCLGGIDVNPVIHSPSKVTGSLGLVRDPVTVDLPSVELGEIGESDGVTGYFL
jgi:hypothetical protein